MRRQTLSRVLLEQLQRQSQRRWSQRRSSRHTNQCRSQPWSNEPDHESSSDDEMDQTPAQAVTTRLVRRLTILPRDRDNPLALFSLPNGMAAAAKSEQATSITDKRKESSRSSVVSFTADTGTNVRERFAHSQQVAPPAPPALGSE